MVKHDGIGYIFVVHTGNITKARMHIDYNGVYTVYVNRNGWDYMLYEDTNFNIAMILFLLEIE